jgi:putative protease
MLATLVQAGLRRVMLGNLGHLSLVREHALVIDGDFRLNVTNRETVAVLERMGFSTLLLSPELTLPQIRDIPGALRTVVYGRIPLMLLEKCVIKELADCSTCEKNAAVLTDRRGQQFPVRRTYRHRNVIYNSHPTYMADRAELLDRHHVGGAHFIFSDESPVAVDATIRAYKNGTPPDGTVRRIGK